MSLCIGLEQFFSDMFVFILSIPSSIHAFGILSSNYGSLVATLLAATALFAVKEFSNNASKCSGVFFTKSIVELTEYNPHKGMEVFHTFVLFSDGYIVSGTSEKTGDNDLRGGCEYVGGGKIRGVVVGRIERNYIRSSVINLHIVEQGLNREITTYMSIPMSRFSLGNSPMYGKFYTTASNSKGSVLCGREKFNEHPCGCSPLRST